MAADLQTLKIATSGKVGLGDEPISEHDLSVLSQLYGYALTGTLAELKTYLQHEADMIDRTAKMTKAPEDARLAGNIRKTIEVIDELQKSGK